MRNRRQMVSGAVVLVTVGLIGLYNVTSKPRFDTFQTVDVVQLIATGMCVGRRTRPAGHVLPRRSLELTHDPVPVTQTAPATGASVPVTGSGR